MDRYENSELGSLSRTKRNQDIYNSTDMSELSRIKTNTNVSVISDAPKEIDIEKIKKYINSLNGEQEEKRQSAAQHQPAEIAATEKGTQDKAQKQIYAGIPSQREEGEQNSMPHPA